MGGVVPGATSVSDFNNCIDNCGLEELNLTGHAFSWSNSSIGSPRIECKMDRASVNSNFYQLGLNFKGSFLSPGLSDHRPILIYNDVNPTSVKSPFRYGQEMRISLKL